MLSSSPATCLTAKILPGKRSSSSGRNALAFAARRITRASAFAVQALANRAAWVRLGFRLRSFAREHMPLAGVETETGPLCSSHLHKSPALSYLPRYRTAAKDTSDPLERFRFAPGLRPRGGNVSVAGRDYFFFFEVFFATFLVAAFAVFFAFFAFLAMSSSVKKTDSVNVRTPCIDLRNADTISRMQN